MTGPVSSPPTALGTGVTPPSIEAQRAQMRAAAQQFEAIFLRQMIGSMRQAHLADDVFGSASSEQFRDMADARLADSMSQQGSFGIAELLLAQFNRALPANPPGAAPATPAANSDGTRETRR